MVSMHTTGILLISCCLFFVVFKQLQFVSSHDFNVSHYASGVGCIDDERQALIEFKGSLVDDAHRLLSWTGKDCCNWDGITCNNLTGHVVKVDLRNPIQFYFEEYPPFSDNFDDYRNHCLRGEVNPSICDLEHLIYLDLSSNNFSGAQIPKCFGSLRNLRYLNLSAAGLGGEIPPQLGNLSNLQHLDMSESSFGVIYSNLSAKNLEWVAGFSFLESLDLFGVDLSKCLDWLNSVNMLRSLSSLNLRNCKLPSDISPLLPSHFNLTLLISLDVGWNNLNSASLLSWWVSNLTSNLQVIKLDRNGFKDPFLLELQELTVLDISFNSFNNSLWLLDTLCNHTNLASLYLSSNQLEGSLPDCLGNLTSLKVLDLSLNAFGGKVPSQLGYLKQLTYLSLSANSFNSSIPSSFGELSELEFLSLQYNQFCGKVPSTLGQLSKLKYLDISSNLLIGEISELHFMNLKSLIYLDLSENQFLTFSMSPNWIAPFQLWIVGMNSVYMGNQFPAWLQNQKNVAVLYLGNVSVPADAIPDWFWTTFSGIQQLDLSFNNMYGMVPSSIKNLKSLAVLHLGGNKFNGTVPEWIGELSQLYELHLQSNNLHGMLPSSLKNLKYLISLDLSGNQLNGTIPEWIGQELTQLQFLGLQSNNFYGMVPSSLKNLKQLYYLDLSHNRFTGTITEWIGKELSALGELRLQSNNFYGNIPVQLCQLPNLSIVRLANNSLTGNIPDWQIIV